MWLDKLDQLVQTLADRIKQHGHILRGNEQATRYALIDPLLAGLGWNLDDPSEVVPEYRLGDSGQKKVDYAMLHDGEPYLLIEAKHLDEPLLRAAEQAGQYALTTRAHYVVLTDGQRWKGYSLGGPGNKHVFSFNVARSGSVALDLLWLWHGNFKGRTTQPKLHAPSSGEAVSATVFSPVLESETIQEQASTSLPRLSDQTPTETKHLLTGEDAVRVITGKPRDATYVYVEEAQYKEPKRNSIDHVIYEVIKGRGPATGHFIIDTIGSRNGGRGFKRPHARGYMTDYDVAWALRLLVQKERLHVHTPQADE